MAKVRTRKRGRTYSYIFEAGKKPDGKRKVVEKGGFATKDEAYNAGVEAYTDYKHGNIGVVSERMTMDSFIDLWLKRVEKDIKANTRANYENIIEVRIKPYLGNIVLQEIKPAEIDNWLQKLYTEGLSKGYITQCRAILKAAMDYAVYPCELLASNPCIYTKVPKKAPTKIIERSIISSQQFDRLMQVFPLGNAVHIPIVLMYHTGMRLGEALGLTWDDIDFKERSITIDHQLIYENAKPFRHRITTTKTEQSKRKIFVTDELLDELNKERNRQQELAIINAVDSEGYCYSFSDGLAVMPVLKIMHLVCVSSIGRIVSRRIVIDKLRGQGLNSHSFRHTQATRLASAGVQPITAARRLGHSKPDTTLNIYTHDNEIMQKNAVESLEIAEMDTFFSS